MDEDLITDSIELRKEYERKIEDYERLMQIVSVILDAAIEKRKIKIHSMKYRVKDYPSFLEKVERKKYKEPLGQCTDLAGCRILCLFLSQVEDIKKIIEEEFDVIEVTDKKSTKKFDQFGYLSLHMLVKIPKNRLKFIECEGLENLVCEIQIRTILQEVWAEIEHYLNYKTTKEEKNEVLLRKIFSLAGMFEVADSTFEEISHEFSAMMKQKDTDDTVTALHIYKFSKEHLGLAQEWDKSLERKFHQLSSEIKNLNIKRVSELHRILEKHSESINPHETPVSQIRTALALEYGKKFDLVFGLKGFSDAIKRQKKLRYR
jgi:ppGpp synthetase/RelA/SpoT-type nucleotidyltranferase